MSPWLLLPPDAHDGQVLEPFSDMNIVPHETHFAFCMPCIYLTAKSWRYCHINVGRPYVLIGQVLLRNDDKAIFFGQGPGRKLADIFWQAKDMQKLWRIGHKRGAI
jgi:hypothetical protein